MCLISGKGQAELGSKFLSFLSLVSPRKTLEPRPYGGLSSGMKTVTVTEAQPELCKLVEEVFRGTEVVLAFRDKRVRLERYEPSGGVMDSALEENSAQLEEELLKAARGTFTPYSRQDLEAIAEATYPRRSII